MAREDPWVFANYIFDRDPCPMHEEWHRALDLHAYWILFAFTEAAKSQQLTIARPLWELGRDPSLQTALIANTATQAELRGRQYRELLAYSDRLHRVFPSLYPGERDSDPIIDVRDRPRGSTDPSIRCVGVHGPLRQSRLNIITADDASDFGNTLTEHERDKTHGWLLNEIVGRLLPGGRFRIYGNAVHPDDFMHRFEHQGWPTERYGVEFYEDVVDPATGAVLHRKGDPRFPTMWTRERIAERRRVLGTLEAARQLDCVARDDSTSMFKASWVARALENGRPRDENGCVLDKDRNASATGIVLSLDPRSLPPGSLVLTGTDLGVSKAKHANESALCDVLVRPDCHRRLLCVEGGKWDPPETAKTIDQHHNRYGGEVWVENVGQQGMLLKMMPTLGYGAVRAHNTGSSEPNLIFEARQLAWEMESGLWSFPSDVTGTKPANSQVERLCKDILNYREGEHVPDRMSALLIARSHAPLRPYAPAPKMPTLELRAGELWVPGQSTVSLTGGRREREFADPALGWRRGR